MKNYFRPFNLNIVVLLVLFFSVDQAQAQQQENISPRRQAINQALDAFEDNSTIAQEQEVVAGSNQKEEVSQEVPAKPSEPKEVKSPENSVKETDKPQSKKSSMEEFLSKAKVTGQIRASMGLDSDGKAIFTRSNANLMEKDYRLLDEVALDKKTNTYDPQLYSRLKVVTDAPLNKFVDLHLNVTVDPWSYVGKTQKFTSTSAGGDTASFQYFFWGNTGYTINQNINSLNFGNVIAMREIKVHDGYVPGSLFQDNYGNVFNVPSLKVDYTFWPFREAWVDIKPETDTVIRVFPMAFSDQALTTDDPLKLSNNTMYWAESPWLWSWQTGNLNTGAAPVNFTNGQWDRSLAFAIRDSDFQRLTALRGASIKIKPDEDNSIEATIATPKTLWQEYSEVNSIPGSVRMKHYVNDQAYVGTVTNMHLGYNEGSLDASNYTGGIDGGFVPVQGVLLNGQYSSSTSHYNQTAPSSIYTYKKQGNAYYVSASATSNADEMIRKDYFTLAPIQKNDNFYKTRLYYGRLDKDFESTLSNYHDTRQDSFWSRHMTFYPNTYRNMPGVKAETSENDLESFAYGNGMDYGRNVIGWRADSHLMQGRLKGLFDFRRVMDNENYRHIETVARTQWTLQATDRLITKGLLMWHALPNTQPNVDPFVYDHSNGDPLVNYSILGDKDPSLKTGSLGARYELTPWANINGVWEYTNDFTLASNNIPSGLLQNVNFTTNDGLYRKVVTQVYGPFQKPSYDYHNIFKTGLELIPTEQWHLYLDYTRNPNQFAGNIDDNMNHFGIESSYTPTKNLGFFARYTYSKWYSLTQVYENQELHYKGYHNVFLETRYLLPDDGLLSLQYGVGPSYSLQTSSVSPSLSYYANPTLETEHLFRLIYDKKF